MPKVSMDFSKTIIYHFVCNDENVKCSYVGSTTNFSKRKYAHKKRCIDETDPHYHIKVYQFIRENGGWTNWTMKPLEEYSCENKTQQIIREQFWIEQLKPEMNCKAAYTSVEDKKIKHKEYVEANKEKIQEDHKAWLEANKERTLETEKKWREKNKELRAEKRKKYYETFRK